jgi:hypothetical protein
MPKVINVVDFKGTTKEHIEDLLESKDQYAVVANEVISKRSFIVITPDFFMELCDRAGYPLISKSILETLKEIEEKISEKYRKMRLSR